MDKTLDLTIIVPLFNEAESLPELVRWINRTLDGRGWEYEIIMVDDGSTDGSWKVVRELAEADGRIHGIRFRRNYGKSAALYHGFKAAGGNVVVTMDADLQDSPEEIPEMYRMVTEDGWDVVFGLETASAGQQAYQESAFQAVQCYRTLDYRHSSA